MWYVGVQVWVVELVMQMGIVVAGQGVVCRDRAPSRSEAPKVTRGEEH